MARYIVSYRVPYGCIVPSLDWIFNLEALCIPRTQFVIDYLRSGMVYNFGRFCMSVCLSDDNF